MKLKTKFAALAATICLLGGALVGCGGDKPEPTPSVDKYFVTATSSSDYTIAGLSAEGYAANATVTFSVTMNTDMKVVKTVKWDTTVITAGADGKYSFTMPEKNVALTVTLDSYALSVSGKSEIGETVTLSLKLGGVDVNQVFTVEGKEAADTAKVTISGTSVTLNELGEVNLVAKIGEKVVAEKKLNVGESTKTTLAKQFAYAWENVENFNDNSKETSTPDNMDLEGKVVAMGTPFTSGSKTTLEMLLDDGTAILDYQVKLASATTEFTSCELGDTIKVNTKLQNYKGLIEAYSGDVKWITKTTSTFQEQSFVVVEQIKTFDDAAKNLISNDMHVIKPLQMTIVGAPEEIDGVTKDRFVVKGATAETALYGGKLALSKSGIDIRCIEGAETVVKGYLVSANSSNNYCNFMAVEQILPTVTAVEITGAPTAELTVNDEVQLGYRTTPLGGGKTVVWESSEPTKISVSEAGVVKALEKGATAQIKVTVDGIESAPVTVTVASKSLASLAIGGQLAADKVYFVGDKIDFTGLTVTATFDDETTDTNYTSKVTFESTPATLTEAGDNIEVSIVAKVGNIVSPAHIGHVKAIVEPGTVESDPLTAAEALEKVKGYEYKQTTAKEYYVKGIITDFYDDVTPYIDYSSFEINFKSDVDKTKLVKGAVVMAHGKLINFNNFVKFDGTDGVALDSSDATKVTLVEITGEAVVVKGETLTLAAKAYPEAAATGTIAWDSSNKTVATVASTGVVTTLLAGTTNITATYGTGTDAVSAKKEVTVTDPNARILTASYSGGTSNLEADKNVAETIGLDKDLVDVRAIKNDASNNVGVNKDGTIRLYGKDGNGNALTFTFTGATVDKIVVEKASASNFNNLEVKSSSTATSAITGTVDGNNATYLVGTSFFSLKDIVASGTTQVQIKSITIYITLATAE